MNKREKVPKAIFAFSTLEADELHWNKLLKLEENKERKREEEGGSV